MNVILKKRVRIIRKPSNQLALTVSALFLLFTFPAQSYTGVQWWISSQDMSKRLTPGTRLALDSEPVSLKPMIHINANKTYQTMIGLSSSLEHSTCYNISLLPSEVQENVVERIVCPDKGIGMNLMRVCIGTPDFTASPWYSYDDMPPGQNDPELKHFSIEKDRKYVLPVLKLALKKNPMLRFFASPWSPPGWMKTNGSLCGGRINSDYY